MTRLAALLMVAPATALAHPGHGGEPAPWLPHVTWIAGAATAVLVAGRLWTWWRARGSDA